MADLALQTAAEGTGRWRDPPLPQEHPGSFHRCLGIRLSQDHGGGGAKAPRKERETNGSALEQPELSLAPPPRL